MLTFQHVRLYLKIRKLKLYERINAALIFNISQFDFELRGNDLVSMITARNHLIYSFELFPKKLSNCVK